MNFYVAALLLYLVIIPIVIVSSVGLWAICARGWRAYNDCKVGAGAEPCPRRVREPQPETSPNTFPREWVLARTGPYNQEDDAA